jgi:tetratricopeptide (TPR) repeat protein
MGAGHAHPHPAWGEPRPGAIRRALGRLRSALGVTPAPAAHGLGALPLALRRGELAATYLAAEREGDHERAATTAVVAMERAIASREWWPADAWAHRALWHFEQAQATLEATRQARRIGDLRVAAGDPESARRYYAEAIDEARDIGAEHEQGLAAVGLGRALMELGRVTEARRLASGAVDLLERSSATDAEIAEARELMGREVAVGERSEEDG